MDDEVRVKQRKDDTSMTSVNCTRRFDEVDDRGNKKMLIAVNCQTVTRSTQLDNRELGCLSKALFHFSKN